MRWLWLALAALVALVLAFAPAAHDRLIYNHTPSVPVGLYLRMEHAPLARGAFVSVRARDVAPAAALARGFDGRFIKRVAALGGDHVCAAGDALVVNYARRVPRRTVDSAGAPLVGWMGCRVLEADEVLLLGDTPDSFDGRYWGPVDRALIEGVWRRL